MPSHQQQLYFEKNLEDTRKKERMQDVRMFVVEDNILHDLQTLQIKPAQKANQQNLDHQILDKTVFLLRKLFKVLYGMHRSPTEDKGDLHYVETQLKTQQRLLDRQAERISTLEAQYLNMIKFATRTKEEISTCTLSHPYFVQAIS